MHTRPCPTKVSRIIQSRWQDVIAGLSIAGLLLPEAVAYSSIGNLPPQAGVIALFAGLICYGLFGSSRFAIVSATSSSAAVLAAATASIANGDAGFRLTLAIGLVLITGLFFLLAGLARMGGITDFIAKPVLRGFAFGLAIVIILKQCANVAGVHPLNGDMIRFVSALISQIALWNPVGIAVGAVALSLLFLLARIRRLPGGLVVIVLGIAAGKWLDLPHYGVGLAGAIHLELATPTLPLLSRSEWLRLGELGFAMVMILYAESYGSIHSFAKKHDDPVLPNRDLLALGASNLVSGLFHGLPVGAGYSATAANEAAGAVSRLAGWVAALVVLAIVLTLLPSIALLPEPVLAAIVIHALSHTLRPAIFRPYFTWRRDRLLIIVSVTGVLLLGVLDGLLAAVGISLLLMLQRFSESGISVLGRLGQGHDFVNMALHPEAQAVAGVIILRPDEPLFFANAERILSQARQTIAAAGTSVHTVILSLEESPDLDSSSLEALLDFFGFVTAQEKRLLLARLKDPVLEILKRIVPPGLAASSFSGLSVDEAVHLAQLHQTSNQ
jgi:MFS superfamily sulfate permease-like transporter